MMRQSIVPFLLLLITVSACIPDLPDVFEETYFCESDDDCLNTGGKYFICYKWLQWLDHAGYGDSETDYSKGVCVDASGTSSCGDHNNCPGDDICYPSSMENLCFNPCDAVGQAFCSRYDSLSCKQDKRFAGGFLCGDCQNDEQCPDNHRCIAAKEETGPGLCVPQCDNLDASCSTYQDINGSCLVLKGIGGNTTQACAPCNANDLCNELGRCEFSPGQEGDVFTRALNCSTNDSGENCNYNGNCDPDEYNCSDCQGGDSCDFDGTCEGGEYDCSDCILGCEAVPEDEACDRHEYCDASNGEKHCRCDCDYTNGVCDIYNGDPPNDDYNGEECICDADCNTAMQDCIHGGEYGQGPCVIAKVNDEGTAQGAIMGTCFNPYDEDRNCTAKNGEPGLCLIATLAEEWAEADEEKTNIPVCVPCPETCGGTCTYDELPEGESLRPVSDQVDCGACESHEECASNPHLKYCMDVDGSPQCMFVSCENNQGCEENQYCTELNSSDAEKRCVPACGEGINAGEECQMPDNSDGLCNWVTTSTADGENPTQLVCVICECDEDCLCSDETCPNQAQSYQDSITCDYECTEHRECFTGDSQCNQCLNNVCTLTYINNGCSPEHGCLVFDDASGGLSSTCEECGTNEHCSDGKLCSDDYQCVTCREHADCGDENLGCNENNECTKLCTQNTDCFNPNGECHECADNGVCKNQGSYCQNSSCLVHNDSFAGQCGLECGDDSDCDEGRVCHPSDYRCVETCNVDRDCASTENCYACDDNNLCAYQWSNSCTGAQNICVWRGNTSACVSCSTDSECDAGEICAFDYKCRRTCNDDDDCDAGSCVTTSDSTTLCFDNSEKCPANQVGEDWGGDPCGNGNMQACLYVYGIDSNGDDVLDINDTMVPICIDCPAYCSGGQGCRAWVSEESTSYYVDIRVQCDSNSYNETQSCNDAVDNDYDGAVDCADNDCWNQCCYGGCTAPALPHCIVSENADAGTCVQCIEDGDCGAHSDCIDNACTCDESACANSGDGFHCDLEESCTNACQLFGWAPQGLCTSPWSCNNLNEENVGECTANNGDLCDAPAHCTSGNCVDNFCCAETSCATNETCETGVCLLAHQQSCSADGECASDYCADLPAALGGKACCDKDFCTESSGWTCGNFASICLLDDGSYGCIDNSECNSGACACSCDDDEAGTCTTENCTCDPDCSGYQGTNPVYGTCAAAENTCNDALDNNNNGLADCADFGCQGMACSILHPGKTCSFENESCSPIPLAEALCPDGTFYDGTACTYPFANNDDSGSDYSNGWDGMGNSTYFWGLSADEERLYPEESSDTNQSNYGDADMIVDKVGNPWIIYHDQEDEKILYRRWDSAEAEWVGSNTDEPLSNAGFSWHGLQKPSIDYAVVEVNTGSAQTEEVEIVAMGWVERHDCYPTDYMCSDFNQSQCEDPAHNGCEWNGAECENSFGYWLNCDGDGDCTKSGDVCGDTSFCCNPSEDRQAQRINMTTFTRAESESEWTRHTLSMGAFTQNDDNNSYELFDPAVRVLTHDDSNDPNRGKTGDVVLSFVSQQSPVETNCTTKTFDCDIFDSTSQATCESHQGCAWNSGSCDLTYTLCIPADTVREIGQQHYTFESNDNGTFCPYWMYDGGNSGLCNYQTPGNNLGANDDPQNPLTAGISHRITDLHNGCSDGTAEAGCEAIDSDGDGNLDCRWDISSPTVPCLPILEDVAIKNPVLSWSRHYNAEGADLGWTYYSAWQQDAYQDGSTLQESSTLFMRRLSTDDNWEEAGEIMHDDGETTQKSDEDSGFLANWSGHSLYTPELSSNAYGLPMLSFISRTDPTGPNAIRARTYGTDDTWTSVSSTPAGEPVLDGLDYITTACGEHLFGWENDANNVQLIGFNDGWSPMGRETAPGDDTLLARINDGDGASSQITIAFSPRDTDHNQTLCAAWRHEHTDETYGIFAVCKDMDTDTASSGKYCCDGDSDGECTLLGIGEDCTANYECSSGICDASTNKCVSPDP